MQFILYYCYIKNKIKIKFIDFACTTVVLVYQNLTFHYYIISSHAKAYPIFLTPQRTGQLQKVFRRVLVCLGNNRNLSRRRRLLRLVH